ncbi:unnamed protein product [Absidia cylindrospora]
MAKANAYMNDYNLSFGNTKVNFNDFYHQDQGTFDYNPTSHSLIQDMDSLMYTQQPGPNDTTLTDMVTAAPGMVYLNQNEQGVYTSPNSDMVGSCTTSAQNTLPTMTGSSSSSTMESDTTNMIMTASTSVTTSTSTSTSSPPPSSTWTPSASPSSTSSASLACMNGPLLLPVSSSTSSNDPSFLSSLSPSLSMGTSVDAMNYISNNHNNTTTTGQQQQQQQQQSSDAYPSPMPTYHQQHHSASNDHMFSPTFMPSSSHRSSLISIKSPRTTASLPTMTTSTSAPTAMMSTNDAQTPSSEFQHSMDFKLSPQPIHETEKDQDSLPMDHSQTQSNVPTSTNTEIRRQIHIQSEQKRRAQIKDGFEDLRNELPSCLNKKMSKVALLQRTVQHIQHLKSTQITILGELERLMNENEHLKKFQENVIQRPGSVKSYQNPNSM